MPENEQFVHFDTGVIQDGVIFTNNTITKKGLNVKALLFYPGNHKGQEFSVERCKRIAQNSNAYKKDVPIQVDHQLGARDTVGYNQEFLFDENGKIYGNLNILGKDNTEKFEEGLWKRFSIGLDLKNDRIYEISVTSFPALKDAMIQYAADLPIAERNHQWDGGDAEKRVRDWSNGDWAKYGKAFFWHDASKPELMGSYKLPFADIVNGSLMAIPQGIISAWGVMNGAMGGVDMPAGDKATVMARIKSYHDKIVENKTKEAKAKMSDSENIVNMAEFEKMKAEFAERTQKLEMRAQEAENKLRFAEDKEFLEKFVKDGRITASTYQDEIELYHSLDEKQRERFIRIKEAQPAKVDFNTYNNREITKPGDMIDAEEEKKAFSLAERRGWKKTE